MRAAASEPAYHRLIEGRLLLEPLHRLVWDTLGSLAAVDTLFFYCAEAYAAWPQKLTQARINRQNELRRRRLCGRVLDAEQSL